MNYKKIYDQIIERARTRVLTGYIERHHIVPRSIGGEHIESNIVSLTAREHFICHRLLVKIYPDSRSLKYAFNMMCNRFKEFALSSRDYQEVKQSLSHSEDTKQKCSDIKKEWWASKQDRSYEALYGTERANELKLIRAHDSANISDETRKKISDANRRRTYKPMSEETKQKIREKRKLQDMSSLRGIPRSEETKRRISETKRNKIK